MGIINTLNELSRNNPNEAIEALNLSLKDELSGLRASKKVMVISLLKMLVQAKHTYQDSISLSVDFRMLLISLKEEVHVHLQLFCEQCGLISDVYCPECMARLSYDMTNHNLSCSCGRLFNPEACMVMCEVGHQANETIDNLLLLLPKNRLHQMVFSLLKYIPGLIYDRNNEHFFITNHSFNYHLNRQNYILTLDDIPGLNYIRTQELDEETWAGVLERLRRLMEKCSRNVTNERCNRCIDISNINCLPKIFYFLDGFRPHPHHGQEFGDVSFIVNVDGINVTFQGIAKSYDEDGFTLASKTGRELIQQFFSGARDPRVGVIGYITPTYIHPQLKEDLKYICRLTQKKFLAWEEDNLVKALYIAERTAAERAAEVVR
ncbi:MAG: hypothetical protein M1426_02230 [Patescibacteria group bacterium]|nr:hypothetical protein [Patescibacteria group bacterium]